MDQDGWGAAAAAPEANGQTNGAGDGWGAASDNPPAIQEPQADGQPATDGVDDVDVPKGKLYSSQIRFFRLLLTDGRTSRLSTHSF